MCRAAFLVIACLPVGSLIAQDESKPITPAEALQKIDQKVVVQMEVKSTGGNTARYLNSEADFRSEKNFAVFIPPPAVEKFQKANIKEPSEYYKGKTIIVTGTVIASTGKAATGRPQLRVDDPAQIKVVDKAK